MNKIVISQGMYEQSLWMCLNCHSVKARDTETFGELQPCSCMDDDTPAAHRLLTLEIKP